MTTLGVPRVHVGPNGFRPSNNGMLGPGVYVSQDINKARPYGDGTILTVSVNTGVVKMITRPQDRDGTWQVGGMYHIARG